MALGLFLILIVVIPFCIYLYIVNNKLKQEIIRLEKENINILERKILTNKEEDIHSIETLSTNQQIKSKKDIPSKEKQNTIKEGKDEYLNEISNHITNHIKSNPIQLTDYEQEQENKAIISYQELTKSIKENSLKEKSETEQFLESLKEFRNKLKPK